MLLVATLWWVLFFAAVGLAVGSYLNVVIYRVPRGISTSAPLWSFCPRCAARIHWYDNLPVLSYVRLGGRCRACGAPISPRYPAVELLMATLTLVVLDAFCVAGLRNGAPGVSLGLNDQLYYDWPIILAHVLLFACLLAMSMIDLEHYFIDIRFTGLAVLAGFALHFIWAPPAGTWLPTVGGAWHRPGLTTGVVSIAVTIVVFLMWLLMRRLVPPSDEPAAAGANAATAAEPEGENEPRGWAASELHAGGGPPAAEQMTGDDPTALDDAAFYGGVADDLPEGARLAPAAAGLVVMVFVVVIGSTVVDAVSARPTLVPAWRLLAPMALCFVLIVGGGAPKRASDTEIVDAIESERFSARQTALRELWLLAPAIVVGMVVTWLCLTHDGFRRWCGSVLEWCPRGTWRPMTGLATAASGYVIGGALGWGVRIAFTLALGREAFGTGDIHLMAAAGCVAGWPVVVMGFVLTSFLALLGWVVQLPFKRTRAIPLVPWLSLAFLVVIVFYDRLAALGPVKNAVYLFEAVISGELTGLTC